MKSAKYALIPVIFSADSFTAQETVLRAGITEIAVIDRSSMSIVEDPEKAQCKLRVNFIFYAFTQPQIV